MKSLFNQDVLNEIKIRLHNLQDNKAALWRETALSVRLPDPIRMAISSASLKTNLPLSLNFSLG